MNRLSRRGGARRLEKRLALFLALSLLYLSGCSGTPSSTSTNPFTYRGGIIGVAQSGAKSELDVRIEFLEKRMQERPKAFLEQAELSGLYLQKGKLRRQSQPIEKARYWAQTSLANFPNDPARLVQADLLQMEHKFEDSLKLTRSVLEQNPSDIEAAVLATRTLLAQGKPEDAKQTLEPVANQPLFAILFLRGQVAEAEGDTEGAVKLYQEALARERELEAVDEPARLRGVWARLELERGDLEKAQQLLESAQALSQEIPLVDLQRAKLAQARKDPKLAAEILRQAFALHQDPIFLLELAQVQESQNQTSESKESYQAVAGLVRNHPFGHERDLALALLKLDPQSNKPEILDLMGREMKRRQDPATLAVWAQVRQVLGPLPSPTPPTDQ